MAKGNEVLSPNFGLYLDRPLLSVPPRGLSDGYNFRIQDGKVSNLNLGWIPFESFTLNGPVLLITSFLPVTQGLPAQLIFGTRYDLYLYSPNTHSLQYLTPRYAIGSITSVAGTAVTGTGSSWTNATAHIRAGDEIVFGNGAAVQQSDTWYTIDHVVDDTHLVLTTAAPAFGPNGAYTIRRKFSGGDATQWSTATYVRGPTGRDTWWATNGVDNIVSWDTVNTYADDEFTGLVMGFKAKQLFVFSNMMIFGNVSVGGALKGTDIINSDVGDPKNVATGLFSEFKVHSGSDEILTMGQLGSNMVIYSKNHVVQAQFIGSPAILAFRTMGTHVGPVSSRAVADYGNYHEFLGRDSQYIFDGVNITELSPHVWKEVLRTQDPLRIGSTYNHFDLENRQVLWVVPLTTDPGSSTITSPAATAYVEHYLEQVPPYTPRPYSRRAFPFTASGFYTKQSVTTWNQLGAWNTLNYRWNDQFFFKDFPFSLVGDAAGKLWQLNASQDANGVVLPSFVKFGRRPTVDGKARGLVTRVYPWVTSFNTPVLVSVNLTDFGAKEGVIHDTQSFDQTMPEGAHFTNHYRRGRYVEIGFSTIAASQPWELHGFDMDIKPGGRR